MDTPGRSKALMAVPEFHVLWFVKVKKAK